MFQMLLPMQAIAIIFLGKSTDYSNKPTKVWICNFIGVMIWDCGRKWPSCCACEELSQSMLYDDRLLRLPIHEIFINRMPDNLSTWSPSSLTIKVVWRCSRRGKGVPTNGHVRDIVTCSVKRFALSYGLMDGAKYGGRDNMRDEQ